MGRHLMAIIVLLLGLMSEHCGSALECRTCKKMSSEEECNNSPTSICAEGETCKMTVRRRRGGLLYTKGCYDKNCGVPGKVMCVSGGKATCKTCCDDDLCNSDASTIAAYMDMCMDKPCENGGTCRVSGGGVSCSCPQGYQGPTCKDLTDLCVDKPCENGGTCSVSGGGVSCSCPQGYQGPTCEDLTEPPCSRLINHHIEVTLCDIMKTENDYTSLHATRPGGWPTAGVCRVMFIDDNLNLDQYVYTVDLYNQAGWQGPNSGHPGVIFNVIDSDNFDFVYFRPHWANRDGCVQHGYFTSGKFYATTEARCTASPVVGSTWFTVKVESSEGRASVYVNNVKLSEVNAHFPTRSQTGIFAANGFSNVIRFRNPALTTLTN
nr:lectin 4-1 [Arenicola marina]